MTESEPFYKKSTSILFGLILLVYVLYLLADILVPLAFSVLLAVLLNPLYNRLHRLRLPKLLAIILTLLIAILVLAGLLYFLSSQIIQFGEMVPPTQGKVQPDTF